MSEISKCSQCGGENVMADVEVRTNHWRGVDVRARVLPERLFSSGATAALHARVCLTCGSVELYVKALDDLRGVAEKRARKGAEP